jgi:hypothetical protein
MVGDDKGTGPTVPGDDGEQSVDGRGGRLDAAVDGANLLSARWAHQLPAGSSSVFSGVALWPLLAVLAAAASGQGRAELEGAVGVPGDRAAAAAMELLTDLGHTGGLRSALGLWTDSRVPLSPWCLSRLGSGHRGRLTGDAVVDGQLLDRWVSDQTGGG